MSSSPPACLSRLSAAWRRTFMFSPPWSRRMRLSSSRKPRLRPNERCFRCPNDCGSPPSVSPPQLKLLIKKRRSVLLLSYVSRSCSIKAMLLTCGQSSTFWQPLHVGTDPETALLSDAGEGEGKAVHGVCARSWWRETAKRSRRENVLGLYIQRAGLQSGYSSAAGCSVTRARPVPSVPTV